MLVGVATLLAASLSVGGAGVGPGLPGASADIAPVHSGIALDVDLTPLRGVTGLSLLAQMSQLSLVDIGTFVAESPMQVEALLAAPPPAARVSSWWGALGTSERASLVAAAPELVGNLEGIPFRERSRANLRHLARVIADDRAALAAAPDRATRDKVTAQLAVLVEVQKALEPQRGGPKRSLILLDTDAGGRAGIALGNPDTADYVSYLVPGMNYNVREQIVNWSATAEALYAEQVAVLAAQGEHEPGSVATIAWIGYETPDLFSVGGLDRADAGADLLERSWLGMNSSRAGRDPYLSVFAHSYGSTLSLVTLARGSVEVDALVVVGSPGSAVQSAGGLAVRDGNVYVGEADWDPAVDSAFFGSDPGAESYGARTLGVTGARDRVTGAWLHGSVGHNDYFTPGSESLHNMALIGTDNGNLVTTGSE